jgi:hypothetical protein
MRRVITKERLYSGERKGNQESQKRKRIVEKQKQATEKSRIIPSSIPGSPRQTGESKDNRKISQMALVTDGRF